LLKVYREKEKCMYGVYRLRGDYTNRELRKIWNEEKSSKVVCNLIRSYAWGI